jgi:microcystin-dependent protein
MGVTSRRAIHYPDLADAADISQIAAIAAAADLDVIYDSGVAASRPVRTAGSPGMAGVIYYATDTGVISLSLATAWVEFGTPSGSVIDWPYGAGDVPASYILPYGQAVLRSSFPRLNLLASNAGYPHGNGDGTTTFNLPDYRGRIGIGKDDMGGVAANRITAPRSGLNGLSLGVGGGVQDHVLDISQIPTHNHGGGAHDHGGVTGPPTNSVPGGSSVTSQIQGGSAGFWAEWGLPHYHAIANSGTIIATQGGGAAHTNVQPGLIVNKLLKT